MNQAILDHFRSELSRSSEHTQKAREFYAQKFLDFAGDKPFNDWNKTLVNQFLKQLEREGYASGTIRRIYSIVKRVFDSAKTIHEAERTRLISAIDPNDTTAVAEILKAMSLPGPTWDMGKRSAPRVDAEDVVKPAATFDELKAMIEAAKAMDAPARAYLSLASLYGLRREELCRVRQEHLDLEERTIYVLTAKGGERRKQLLCEEIIPHLEAYSFKGEYTPFKMTQLYLKICAQAGIEHKDGSGWHSIRRYLDTTLVDMFDQLMAHIFLRWKISSSSEMAEVYYSKSPLEIDQAVLEKYPVVPLWR